MILLTIRLTQMKDTIYTQSINPKYTKDNPFNRFCIYCDYNLAFQEIEPILNLSFDRFKTHFTSRKICMQSIHGLDDSYFDLKVETFNCENTYLGQCPVCGWWKASQEYTVDSEFQFWQNYYETCGVIRNLDVTDLTIPMTQLRAFLVSRYQHLWNVHPAKFEQLVADVFNDFGYSSVCTAYSCDGGIDVFLQKQNEVIGIQVKRYRGKIKIEQIRAFLGAMLVNNLANGIFISSSEFQSGCKPLAERFAIELIDGKHFYQRIKEAQLIRSADKISTTDLTDARLYYSGSYEMCSL